MICLYTLINNNLRLQRHRIDLMISNIITGYQAFSWEGVTRASCCCSSVGRAWGVNECIKCPEIGSYEYDLICPGGTGFQVYYSKFSFLQCVKFFPTFGGNPIVTSKLNFQPNEKTVILEDIHECLEFGSSLCKNGRCSNTFGSYMCMCKIGFELDKNGVSSKQFHFL